MKIEAKPVEALATTATAAEWLALIGAGFALAAALIPFS